MARSLRDVDDDLHIVVLDEGADRQPLAPAAAPPGDDRAMRMLERELLDLSIDLINADRADLDAAIDAILRRVGEARGIDRILLYRYDWVAGTVSTTHAWCSPGVRHLRDEFPQVPLAAYHEVASSHRRDGFVTVPDRDLLPVDSRLRRLLIDDGVQATISRPLMDGDECLGAIAFETVAVPQLWSAEDRRLLQVLSSLLVNVEHRRRYEAVAKALQELTGAYEALERFTGTVSHDLRSPLASVRGFLDLARSDKVSGPFADELLIRAIGTVDRLVAMNDRLLADARRGGLVTRREPVDLDQVVGVALEQLSARIDARDAVVEVGDLPVLQGDAAQLLQLFQNLIGNAIEHAPADRRPHVWVSARRTRDHVELVVADDGAGIPADERDMALRPSDTVPPDSSGPDPQPAGELASGRPANGLGLAICERIARAHGGTLWLFEAAQGGLAVVLRLPMAADH